MPRVKPTEIQPGSAVSVTWDAVAGLDEAKEELQEIVDCLRDPAKFEGLGARVPKGVLFHGPGPARHLLRRPWRTSPARASTRRAPTRRRSCRTG